MGDSVMLILSRQQRREEKDRAFEEREAAVIAQEKAIKLQNDAMLKEKARALLNVGPDELALMAAKALIESEKATTVHQENAHYTRSVALSNLAIFSAMGAIAGQSEQ